MATGTPRLGGLDAVEDFAVIHPLHLFFTGSIGADNPDPWEFLLQQLPGPLGHVAFAAQQVDAVTLLRGKLRQPGNQVHARHAFGKGTAQEFRYPHQRHSVRQYQAAAGNDSMQVIICK
jgi:hypothetical protein